MSETIDGYVLGLTARIVAAHVENNQVAADTLPDLIKAVYRSVATAGSPDIEQKEPLTPAVPVKRSVFPDFIVCLEDGKKLKMLKRHLKTSYDLSPDRLSGQVGLTPRLSHGGAQLCSQTLRIGEEHRPRSETNDQC